MKAPSWAAHCNPVWLERTERGGKALAGLTRGKGAAACTRGDGRSPTGLVPSSSQAHQPSSSLPAAGGPGPDRLCVLPRGWQTGTSTSRSGLCLAKRHPHTHEAHGLKQHEHTFCLLRAEGRPWEGARRAGRRGNPPSEKRGHPRRPSGTATVNHRGTGSTPAPEHRQHCLQAAAQELCQKRPRVSRH